LLHSTFVSFTYSLTHTFFNILLYDCRERNREHAKRSRKRKKVYVETLQQSILKLQQDNGKLRSTIAHLEQLLSNVNRTMEQQQQTQQQQTQQQKGERTNMITSSSLLLCSSSSLSPSPNHVVSVSPPLNPIATTTSTSSSSSSSCPSFPFLNSTTTPSSTTSLSSYYSNNNSYYSQNIFHNHNNNKNNNDNNYHHSQKKDVSIIEHTLAEINNHNIAYKHRLHLLLPQTTVGNDLIVANPILTSID
jgi:hypothetical protein